MDKDNENSKKKVDEILKKYGIDKNSKIKKRNKAETLSDLKNKLNEIKEENEFSENIDNNLDQTIIVDKVKGKASEDRIVESDEKLILDENRISRNSMSEKKRQELYKELELENDDENINRENITLFEEEGMKNKNSKNSKKVKNEKEKLKFKDLTLGKKILRIIKWSIIVGIALVIVTVLLCIAFLYGMFGDQLKLDKKDIKLGQQLSTIYDRDGNYIATLADSEKRKVIELKDVPKHLIDAYTSIEDQRFFKHHGIDLKRTAGAIVNYVVRKRSSYGGSTITQQLIKNMTKDDDRDWQRKVREMAKAIQIERKLSKDEILELYLNLIFVGGKSIHGVALGADYYFSKQPKDLTIAEAAFMAGINHAPNEYNPFIPTGLNAEGQVIDVAANKEYIQVMEAIKTRSKTVLGKMAELGKITNEQKAEAIAELDKGLVFKQGTDAKSTTKYSNLVDAAIEELIETFVNDPSKNMTPEMAKLAVYGGGYKIYTTQDSAVQQKLEAEMAKDKYIKYSKEHKDENGKAYQSQAAATIIDPKTGQILAACGGLGTDIQMVKGDWNRVTRTKRQVGSTMKPIGILASGLAANKITAGSVFDDAKMDNGARNYTGGFLGYITLREAISRSLNIPMIKALEQIGTDNSYNFLKKMDFPLVEGDKSYSSLALGGLTQGITTVNMASAYAMIANDGEYIKPTFIKEVKNYKDELVFTPKQKKEKMLSPEQAYIAKDVLKSVVNGRGATAGSAAVSGWDIGAKTGTTNDDYDRYFCIINNKYAMAVWYGFDKAESINWYNANPSTAIGSAVMKTLLQGLPGEKFTEPEGIEKAEICRYSGLKPTALCSKDPRGDAIYTEIFVKGTVPTETCNHHIEVEISKLSGKLAPAECKEEYKEKRVFLKRTQGGTADSKYMAPTEYCTLCLEKAKQEELKDSQDTEKIKTLFLNINNISSMTRTDYAVLTNAKNAYEGASQKVKNDLGVGFKNKYEEIKNKVTEIETQIKQEEETQAQTEAQPVIVKINLLNSASTRPQIELARTMYNALSELAKKKVTNYNKLVELEQALATTP